MRIKMHKVFFSALLAASVAITMAPAAQANRGNGGGGGYVPPTTPTTPPVNVQVDLPGAPTVSDLDGSGNGGDPGTAPEVQGISIDSPAVTPAVDSGAVGGQGSRTEPANDGGVFGGVLSRTGSEAMPLVRAGLAAITLGAGLILVARRRKAEAAA